MTSSADLLLQCAALSDPGRVRPHNEDSVAVASDLGLAVLADGMGGYNAGEVASGLATRLLIAELESDLARIGTLPPGEAFPLRQMLQARINQVNLAIYEAAQTEEGCEGMGTTLVLSLFFRGRLTIAHVGDSRAYRLREARLERSRATTRCCRNRSRPAC